MNQPLQSLPKPDPQQVPAWFSYRCTGFDFGCAEDVQQWIDEHLVLAKVTQRIDEAGLHITEIEPNQFPHKLHLI